MRKGGSRLIARLSTSADLEKIVGTFLLNGNEWSLSLVTLSFVYFLFHCQLLSCNFISVLLNKILFLHYFTFFVCFLRYS